MPTQNVNLDEHFERLVERLITSGQYKDASEVMHAGLRLLEQESREDEEKLEVLRGLASESFASLDRGEGTSLEGDQELEEFIRGIGRRAGSHSARDDGGE